jgi:ketosteroid isomerase-like protein
MDAQGTMQLMFDTMDAYDRADFDRLAEIYAEDARWLNADPNGPHCHNRDDIFACSASAGMLVSGSGSTSCAPHRPRSCSPRG